MVEQQTREVEVVSSNPAGRVSREFCAKNAATLMETGGRWPVAASPEKKIAIILGVFSHFHFAECKSLPSAFPALGKGFFADYFFAECPLPSAALGKAFAECILGFVECCRHSAKRGCPVVNLTYITMNNNLK